MELFSVYSKGEFNAERLGGKGFGLWWMQQNGITVPPALIIPTTVCVEYMKNPEYVRAAIQKALPDIRAFFKQYMGHMPLVSVRSGARVSMPGMMDTVLNVGIDGATRNVWISKLGAHCVTDSECRLIEMFGNVVKGIDRHEFEDCTTPDEYRSIYSYMTGTAFPDTDQQIAEAIEAVFNSWNNERAVFYRKMNNIPDDWGTAVVIQAMVFGNLNDQSATGVLFTRNPDSGENVVTGEFLPNAQGEDVVAGIKTPLKLAAMKDWNHPVYDELIETVLRLESLKGDVQDVEFTVEDGKLYILQTRNAKRSAKAAVKIALDMHKEAMLTLPQMFERVKASDYDRAKLDVIDPSFTTKPDFTGIAACSGIVTGVVVRSAQAAIDCKKPCILVTSETTPDDIAGMNAARGILTMTGGSTSHAAVVARSMNKPCVVGLSVSINQFPEGSSVSIDGATGRVWKTEVPVVPGSQDATLAEFRRLMFESLNAVPISHETGSGTVGYLRLADKLTWPQNRLAKLVKGMYDATACLYIDTTLKLEEAEAAFLQPFGAPVETDREQALVHLLESVSLNPDRVCIITTCQTKLPRLSVAETLEQLVLASNVLMWSGEDSAAVQKVMAWKKKEDGLSLMAAPGTLNPNGLSFLSESVVVSKLLHD
jgi:phosphoenolpyruvate synthase/pyruvate phosphate dikinase